MALLALFSGQQFLDVKFLDVLRRLLFRRPKQNGGTGFSNAVNPQIMFLHENGICPNEITFHCSPVALGMKKPASVKAGCRL